MGKAITEAEAAVVMKNIADLIKKGLFFGSAAGYVDQALGFLEGSASLIQEKLKVAAAEAKRAKKAAKLKAVADG